jgi:hypothetical protein
MISRQRVVASELTQVIQHLLSQCCDIDFDYPGLAEVVDALIKPLQLESLGRRGLPDCRMEQRHELM